MPRVATATAQPVLVLTWQPRTTGGPPCHHQHDNGNQCGDDYGDDDSHVHPSGGRRPDAAVHLVSSTSYPSTGCSKRTSRAHSARRPRTGPAGPVRGDSLLTGAGHRPPGQAPRSRPVDLVQRSTRRLHVTWQTTAPGPGPGDAGQRREQAGPGRGIASKARIILRPTNQGSAQHRYQHDICERRVACGRRRPGRAKDDGGRPRWHVAECTIRGGRIERHALPRRRRTRCRRSHHISGTRSGGPRHRTP
jgi:hypothetical protein